MSSSTSPLPERIISSSTSSPPERIIKWGILGTGSIANDMVQILKQLPNTQVLAIGSRSTESAQRFGSQWDIPLHHSPYESLTMDPDIDIVYIATPSLRHPGDCLLALRNDKAVLCEKSMAPNYESCETILNLAREKRLLCVHAVWSRFFPAMMKLRDILRTDGGGVIGDIKSATVSFCQNDGAGSCSALLETGIYCVQFLQWVLSSSEDDDVKVQGATRIQHPNGLDQHVNALLQFPHNKIGTFECSLGHCSERNAYVYGTMGVIKVNFPFWCPTSIEIMPMSGQASQTWMEPIRYIFELPDIQPLDGGTFNFVNSQGLAYEALEMNRCFREGLSETPLFSTKQCLTVFKILSEIDEVSKQKV